MSVLLILAAAITIGEHRDLYDDKSSIPRYELEPRGYIFWPSGTTVRDGEREDADSSSILFEAQIPFTIPLVGFVSNSPTPYAGALGLGQFNLEFLFSFSTQIRMLTEDSNPVISPNYEFSALKTFTSFHRIYRLKGDRNRWTDWRVGAVFEPWHHYSNGQQECAFEEAVRVNGVCDNSNVTRFDLDERLGSFSTNWSGATVFARHGFDVHGPPKSVPLSYVLVSAGYQYHHDWLFPGGLDPALERLWGSHKIRIVGEYRQSLAGLGGGWGDHFYAQIDSLITADPVDFVENPHRLWLEAGVSLQLLPVDLFVRGMFGQDHMNILFSQERQRFAIGAVFDTSSIFPELPSDEADNLKRFCDRHFDEGGQWYRRWRSGELSCPEEKSGTSGD